MSAACIGGYSNFAKSILSSFSDLPMIAVSSGAVTDFSVHEVVDLNAIAKIANKTASSYKEPGK